MNRAADIRRIAGMDPAKLDALKQWLLESDKRPFAAVVVPHAVKNDVRYPAFDFIPQASR